MNNMNEMYETAKNYMPGGVSAGQRYNGTLGMPLYMDRAEGCRLYDVDGNE